MTKTKLMQADEIAYAFNGVTERGYWRAAIAGTRTAPEVNFNSRASMVCVTYRIATNDFTVSFSKTHASFGDFMASVHRSLGQILASLKAAGLPFEDAFGSAPLRIEYDAKSKGVTIHMPVHPDDMWPGVEPMAFKVPQRADEKKLPNLLDGV